MIKKAVIPCAGFGTRLLPITKVIPKELLPINLKPALMYVVEEAINSGIEEILIIISSHKEIIRTYFEENKTLNEWLIKRDKKEEYALINSPLKAKISFAYQDTMNGNANAIKIAKEFVSDEPFAVLFPDDIMYTEKEPVIKQLIKAYEKTICPVVGVQKTNKIVASKCGVMIKDKSIDDDSIFIKGIVEKPSIDSMPSQLTSLGRFILTKDIFDYIDKTPIRSGEVYLTDAINELCKEKSVVATKFVAKRFDVGSKEGLYKANIELSILEEK